MKRWQANLIFLLIAVFWGLGFPLTKEGLEHLGPISFMAWRFLLATLIILAIAPKTLQKIRRPEWVAGLGVGTCLAFGFIVQTIGIQTTSSGKAGFITSLNILIVPVLASFFFGAKVQRKDKLAVILAIVGFAMMSVSSFDQGIAEGDLWVLGCAFFYALQIIGIDRFTQKLDPFRINLVQMVTATLICWSGSFLIEGFTWSEVTAAALPIGVCAVFATFFPFMAQAYAQKHTGPTAAALLMSLEAVFAMLFGFLLHSEVLKLNEYFGCVVIMLATTILLLPSRQKNMRNSSPPPLLEKHSKTRPPLPSKYEEKNYSVSSKVG